MPSASFLAMGFLNGVLTLDVVMLGVVSGGGVTSVNGTNCACVALRTVVESDDFAVTFEPCTRSIRGRVTLAVFVVVCGVSPPKDAVITGWRLVTTVLVSICCVSNVDVELVLAPSNAFLASCNFITAWSKADNSFKLDGFDWTRGRRITEPAGAACAGADGIEIGMSV